MCKITPHPARYELMQQWFDHELPIIEEAYEELGVLLKNLKNRNDWSKQETEANLAVIAAITDAIHKMLGQIVLPF